MNILLFCFLSLILFFAPFICSQTQQPCVFWDTCNIGLLYSSVGIFSPYSLSGLVVADLYLQHVNNPANCGMGGSGIAANIVKIDIMSNSLLILNATKQLIETNGVSILLLPEGPLAIQAALIADSYNIPLIAGMSGVQSLFVNEYGNRRFRNVMGVVTPAPLYMATFLQLMLVKRYSTISVITTTTSPDVDVCSGVKTLAIYSGLQILSFDYINSTNLQDLLQNIEQLKADILISCMSLHCTSLFQEIQNANFNPKAHGTFECINSAPFYSTNLYAFSPVQWDQNVFGLNYRDLPSRLYGNLFPYDEQDPQAISSPKQFYNRYLNATNGGNTPPISSLTASQMAAFYVLDYGVSKANSTKPSEIFDHIQNINIKSFFGLISFDENGQNTNKEMVVRQAFNSKLAMVVYPGRTDSISPMPTFKERLDSISILSSPVEISMIVLSGVSSALSGLLLIVLYKNRHDDKIKAISFLFSSIMIFGCAILSWSHLTWALNNNQAMCDNRVLFWISGIVFILSPLVATSYRVNKIINNERIITISLNDSKLFLFMMIGLSVGSTLIILWQSIQPPHLIIISIDLLRPLYNFSDCNIQSVIFPTLSLVYISLLMILSLHFGYKVRKIDEQYSQYNQAKFIATLVLIIIILTSICSIIQIYISEDNRIVKYAIRSSCAIFISILAQILFFHSIIMRIFFPELNETPCKFQSAMGKKNNKIITGDRDINRVSPRK